MHKNSCSRLIKSLASLIEITHLCDGRRQLFEVTVAADGTELSSKRVSKLSRRYHRHKKQSRQSAMMAKVSSDAWVCPKCSYENQDYQCCMGTGCDEVRPRSMVDTISTQIKNLKENADVYKSVHGEKAYNELLVSLISKMTGTMNKKGTTPSSARSEDNDDGK